MTDHSTAGKIRRWMPLYIIGLSTGVILWFHLAESAFRFYAYIFSPLIGAIALWSWYMNGQVPERRARLRKRTLIGAGIALGLFIALFRFDGSWRGTSLVKFTWRWTPKNPDLAAALPVTAPTPPAETRKGEVTGLLRDWPQYLGPERDSVARGIQLETDWVQHPPTLVWKQPIGLGWGSFAVRGRDAITMEQRGDEELVSCYDVITGQLIWTHADPGRFEGPMGEPGPRSTPTLVDDLVYTQGAGGLLNCLDQASGRVIWSRQVLSELGGENLKYGKSNSPLVTGGVVIATGGDGAGSIMAAYDVRDGSPRWKAPAGKASFTSPSAATLNGREQILYVGANGVMGLDPANGQQLWKWPWELTWPKVAQPVVVDGSRVLVSASYGQGCYLLETAVNPPKPLWESTRLKAKFSNVLIHGKHAYGLDEGILACVDLATGKRVWKEGRYGFGQNILIGDVILVQAEDGSLALVKADPAAFQELAKLPALTGLTWNVPALAGSYLLLRNSQEARCYQLALRADVER